MTGAPQGPLRRALRRLLDDPRRAVSMAIARLRAAFLLRRCERGRSVYAAAWLRVVRRGRIRVGERVVFLAGMIPSQLTSHSGATLEIGDGCVLNYGVSIEASELVHIGRNCMLGSFVHVSDRTPTGAAPVRIGDGAWLAHGVIVEPGVVIGEGAVVAAGSVVTRDVPPASMATGNPARTISLSLVPDRAGGHAPGR